MNTTDKKNSPLNKIPGLQDDITNDKNTLMNEELYNLHNRKETEESNQEITNRGYTIRNGHNPNKPNPDQEDLAFEEDLDDLDDDFHNDRDLESDNSKIYKIEQENEEEELDIDGRSINEVNDEFDNPSDDFNETEEDLDDIDQDDEEEEDEYIEDDVQEDRDEENYPDNDPRKF